MACCFCPNKDAASWKECTCLLAQQSAAEGFPKVWERFAKRRATQTATALVRYDADRRNASVKLAKSDERMGPTATAVVTAAKLYAPPGQCGFCDARREYAREGMRRSRKKATETPST